jgi:phage tail protein X
MEYRTVSGDTFDKIAKLKYGDEKLALNIIEANIEYANIIVFGAGVNLNIPDIVVNQTANLPPWKRGDI